MPIHPIRRQYVMVWHTWRQFELYQYEKMNSIKSLGVIWTVGFYSPIMMYCAYWRDDANIWIGTSYGLNELKRRRMIFT